MPETDGFSGFFLNSLATNKGPSAKPIPEGGTKMKKALFLMLASLFVVASLSLAACGDDDDDDAVDNVAACTELQDTINGLDCYEGYEVDLMCDTYADYACDFADYFSCTSDCYSCDGDVPAFDADTYTNDCVPMASCE
jgi:hypothetical protein